MTLSRFLRDYIYIPLGGNKISSFRTYVNLLATFVIGGLWHGAGWTFVFWGFLHGLALVIHRVWTNLGFKMNTILAWFITFNFVNIAWIFFRAKEWDDAIKVLGSMFSLDNVVLPNPLVTKLAFLKDFGVEFGGFIANLDNNSGKTLIPMMFFAFILVLFFKNSMEKRDSFKPNIVFLVLNLVIFMYSLMMFNKVSEFLYFNF